MASSDLDCWETHPEYIDLLNYVIEMTENVESPLNIQGMAREFKENSGAPQSENCLVHRIETLGTRIQSFEYIETNTKVKMLFALSAPVHFKFLNEWRKNALVRFDEKKRIIHYEANDGSLKLRGEHSPPAKTKSAMLFQINYLNDNNNDLDAVPTNKIEREMRNLIKFVTEKCKNVNSPLNISVLAEDFNKHFGISRSADCIRKRLRRYYREIQQIEFLDTHSKVKQLFGLGAKLDSDCLDELRKDAVVEVDDQNRITMYTSNNGLLTLYGEHSLSARSKLGWIERRRKLNAVTKHLKFGDDDEEESQKENGYSEDDNEYNSDDENDHLNDTEDLMEQSIETNDFYNRSEMSFNDIFDFDRPTEKSNRLEEIEIRNIEEKKNSSDTDSIDLLNFIIEKTENVESPINIRQLAREFKEKSGAPQLVSCLSHRIEKLGTRIQSFEHIDKNTKVKVLFALSASVYAYFLKEWRKNALVKVDDKRRIIHYKADDGSLELKNHCTANRNFIEFITEKCENIHSPLSFRQLNKDFNEHFGITRSITCIRNSLKKYFLEIQNIEFLDTHSKVKQLFGLSAKLDSDCLEELRKDAVVEVDDLNRITKYTSNDGSLTLHGDHSSSAKKKLTWIENRKKKIEWFESKKNRNIVNDDSFERFNKEFGSELDSDDEYDLLDKIEMREDHGRKRENSSPTASTFETKRNKDTFGFSSSNWTGSFSNNSMRPNELDDYDTNYSIEDRVKLEPFRGSIQEDLKGIEEDEDIQQIPKQPQALDEHNQFAEVPIKMEHEDPIEVKPETSHNSKIKFFEAMQTLILCIDTPSLSWIQSKIQQKINKLGEQDEIILNKEIIQIIELLIARMTDHSVENHSKNVKSMNLSNFLCYLKAAILNSKMIGVDGLVKNISDLFEESQNKRILMENVANVLRATLVSENF